MHSCAIMIIKSGPNSETKKAISLEAFQDRIWKPTQDSMLWSRTSTHSREGKKWGHVDEQTHSNVCMVNWQPAPICSSFWSMWLQMQFSFYVDHHSCTAPNRAKTTVWSLWNEVFLFLCIFCRQILKHKSSQRCNKCQTKALSTWTSYERKNFKACLCFYSHHLGLNC